MSGEANLERYDDDGGGQEEKFIIMHSSFRVSRLKYSTDWSVKNEPSWAESSRVRLSWVKLSQVGPSWAKWAKLSQVGPSWAKLSQVEPSWAEFFSDQNLCCKEEWRGVGCISLTREVRVMKEAGIEFCSPLWIWWEWDSLELNPNQGLTFYLLFYSWISSVRL